MHTIDAFYQYILSTHPVNKLDKHTRLVHPVNTRRVHPVNTRHQPIMSTLLYILLTQPINTSKQPNSPPPPPSLYDLIYDHRPPFPSPTSHYDLPSPLSLPLCNLIFLLEND